MASAEAAEEKIEVQAEDSKRERSTIEFPYGDLDDAVEIAKGIHEVGGSSCEWDQLAAKLNQASNGGGFRQRMLTAKTFGLVTYGQGKASLTPLGSRIVDPKQEKAAKADSFLTVPLYRAVFDKFKGGVLPPADAMESEMAGLGVSTKQKGKARQYFQRSAQQAGYFWSGQDRLVRPATPNGVTTDGPPADEKQEHEKHKRKGGDGGDGTRHPLIEGLIRELPEPKTPWPLEARRNWLQLASSLFNVIYDSPDDSRGVLKIDIHRDSAK